MRDAKEGRMITDGMTDAEMRACFRCRDCGLDTGGGPSGIDEYYGVHEAVWGAAGMPREDGMLCIGCLEARLGRQLTHEDLTGAPINRIFTHSSRLRDRLRRGRAPKRGRPKHGQLELDLRCSVK